MTNLHEQLNTAAKDIRLSADEKSAMRAALSHAMAAPSPVTVVPSPYIFISQKWMAAIAALLIVVFGGGSTAFAAQGALPGEPLYAVKIGIIEPLKLALASDSAAKAEVHAQIAAARVEEAEALSQKGTLDATTSAQLASDFDEHSKAALAFADEAKSSNPSAPAQVEAQIQASSEAGGTVLVALARGSHGSNREHSQGLAVKLLARAESGSSLGASGQAKVSTFAATAPAAQVRTMMVMTADTSTSSEEGDNNAQQAAIQLQLKAQAALAAAQSAASSTASTTGSIEESLAQAAQLIDTGSQALKDGQYQESVRALSQALAISLRAQALLKAQLQFHIKTDDNGGDDGGHSGEGGGEVEIHF